MDNSDTTKVVEDKKVEPIESGDPAKGLDEAKLSDIFVDICNACEEESKPFSYRRVLAAISILGGMALNRYVQEHGPNKLGYMERRFKGSVSKVCSSVWAAYTSTALADIPKVERKKRKKKGCKASKKKGTN